MLVREAYYNTWRPISAIRYCGSLGKCSDPAQPSYNTNGLTLVTNLIEVVTDATVASGRHAGLTPGKIAIFCAMPATVSLAPAGVIVYPFTKVGV